MRILITGTNSFIGSNFRRFSKFSGVTEISLRNTFPQSINLQNYDVLLHFAAIVHQDKKIRADEYFSVNRDLTVSLARHAKKSGIKQFIFLSTVKVYGEHNESTKPWKEDSPCFPDEPYGKSKYEAEVEIKKLATQEFKIVIVRTPVVYGAGVKGNVLNLTKLIQKSFILPFGGINNNRHFTYIENLVGFLDRIIESKANGTYIVMDSESISTSYFVSCIAQNLNPGLINFKIPGVILKLAGFVFPGKLDKLLGSFYLNNEYTRRQLNFEPRITTEEGIKRYINEFLKQKS